MNNIRRKQIKKIATSIEELIEQLKFLQEEEQEAFDNLPEGIQMSERGLQMEENIDTIEDSIDDIGNALIELEKI